MGMGELVIGGWFWGGWGDEGVFCLLMLMLMLMLMLVLVFVFVCGEKMGCWFGFYKMILFVEFRNLVDEVIFYMCVYWGGNIDLR